MKTSKQRGWLLFQGFVVALLLSQLTLQVPFPTVAAAPSASLVGDCYILTLTRSCPNPTNESIKEVIRGGTPLSSKEMGGVAAAANKLSQWADECGVQGPTPPGGSTPTNPGTEVGNMLGDGNICKETVGDAKKVAATASNPVTGNGLDGDGCEWQTTGDPGINITGPWIPGYVAGSTDYDPNATAVLAGLLIHELNHLHNPNNAATSTAGYEAPAYQATVGELCKVAGCANASQEDKDAACEVIKSQNLALCNMGKPQVPCPSCEDDGMVHCETPLEEEEEEEESSQIYSDSFASEYYSYSDLRGSILLTIPGTSLEFDIRDSVGVHHEFSIDCSSVQGAEYLKPICFTRISPTAVLVGGQDSLSGYGMMLRVEFDPFAGEIVDAAVELLSSELVVVSCLDKFPYGEYKVALLDHIGDAVFVYAYERAQLVKVADLADSPLISTAQYVHVWPVETVTAPTMPPTPVPYPEAGTLIWATEDHERYAGNGILFKGGARIIDADNDGVFETVE